jgi:hypothetical protein
VSDKDTSVRALVDLPRMSARLTYPTINVREPHRYASIRIEDEDSGLMIAEIDLSPDQLFALMANSTAYGEGRANTVGRRFGRQRVVHTVTLDRKEWGLDHLSDESHPAVQANLKTLRDEGWEALRYEVSHGRHRIQCVKWVDAEGVTE